MKKVQFFLIITTALILSACLKSDPNQDSNNQPVSSSDTPFPTKPAEPEEYEYGETALIDSIDILFLESFPLQVNAIVKGTFPDGCTSIQRHEVKRVENIFTIMIFTQRPKEAFCTEALVPFEYVVPLDVYGLSAGNYLVKAYNTEAEFSLIQDNILQESGGE
jgi:inhibitor of cysteine peptidase